MPPISAASSAATMRPTRPDGSRLTISVGYAMSPLVTVPFALVVNSCGYSAKAMRPGSTSTNTGRILRNPAKIVPAFA